MDKIAVTPFVGVWIEILNPAAFQGGAGGHSLCGSVDWNPNKGLASDPSRGSLPLWECGLKFFKFFAGRSAALVTPFVGVWIEIHKSAIRTRDSARHSLCGSVDWNRDIVQQWDIFPPSLPLWECGLKFTSPYKYDNVVAITPFVGVWIEMIFDSDIPLIFPWSLPLWECGLK